MPTDDLEVTPAQVQELIAAGNTQLVDVREPYEVEAGRIAGSRHIPMNELQSAAASLDASAPIVFYCRVGGRSGMAAQAFANAGYQAHSLAGGLLAWDAAGLPLDPEDGRVADH